MKIIFDADTLVGCHSKSPARSGIFFCAISLLKEFDKFHEITLYTDHKSWAAIHFCKDFKNYKILKPHNPIARFISYGYYIRSWLDPYRKYLPISLICKAITFSVLYLGNLFLKQNKCKPIQADVFVSMHSCSINPSFKNMPNFTLLHDVIPEAYPNLCLKSIRYFFRTQIVDFLSPQNYYFANSQYTKDDFLRLFPDKLDTNKIKVTHLGASSQFFYDINPSKNQIIRQKYKIPQDKKYIFSLCTLEPRKNLLFVAKNFIELIEKENIEDLVFVLGGGYQDSFLSKIQEVSKKHQDKILHIGYIDDEDLSNLFSHSLCSIYLSLYEGFGLPALESMQCGCPIIASNTTSLPEVVGNAGILINPVDSQALQNAILQIYTNPQLREELRQKGLQQAKQFSWEKCAKEMLEYMEEVLKTQKQGEK